MNIIGEGRVLRRTGVRFATSGCGDRREVMEGMLPIDVRKDFPSTTLTSTRRQDETLIVSATVDSLAPDRGFNGQSGARNTFLRK
jgi:hypothetical protein